MCVCAVCVFVFVCACECVLALVCTYMLDIASAFKIVDRGVRVLVEERLQESAQQQHLSALVQVQRKQISPMKPNL